MGFHGALGVTYPDGSHECGERTLDGTLLATVLPDYLGEFLDQEGEDDGRNGGLVQDLLGTGIDALTGFTGRLEMGNGREREQELFAYVDFVRRVIGISDGWQAMHLSKILPVGWVIEEMWDCPEGSPCYEETK